jgi:hypothetical protein
MKTWTIKIRNWDWQFMSTRDMVRHAHEHFERCGLVVVEYLGVGDEEPYFRFKVKGK